MNSEPSPPHYNTSSQSRKSPISRRHRRASKDELMDEQRHWILHELTYPSKDEVQPHTLKHKIWLLFEDPTSSRYAYVMSISIMTMIIISGTSFLIETIPDNPLQEHKAMKAMEMFFVICFTIEYVCRLCSCPNRKQFLLSFLNLIDLFAFLPFYIEIIIPTSASATPILRVVRLTRVFRIMKVSKYVAWIKVFTSAMQKSIRPLGMLLYIFLIGIVLCSTAIYFIEKDVINPQTDEKAFESIPLSFWWAIITMTTVGYGDAVPQTNAGKVIGGLTSLCGILVLALPITVISSNFNAEMEKMKRVDETPVQSIQTLRKLLTERYKNLVEEKRRKHEQEQHKQSPWKRRKSVAVTRGVVRKIREQAKSHRESFESIKTRSSSWNTNIQSSVQPLSNDGNGKKDDDQKPHDLNDDYDIEMESGPFNHGFNRQNTENPELLVPRRQNSKMGSVSVLLSPDAAHKLAHMFRRGDTCLAGVSEDDTAMSDGPRDFVVDADTADIESQTSSRSRNKVSPVPAPRSLSDASRRLQLMSTRDMLHRNPSTESRPEVEEEHKERTPPSLSADKAFDIAPYLTNEDIRGILACHIVGSLVHLIEKEEKCLKQKINDLIKKQFDFLLSDMSRIFSEIPHFHGLNAQAFQRAPSKVKRK